MKIICIIIRELHSLDGHFEWSSVISIFAIIISIIGLFFNSKFAQRNARLAIQQTLFKTVFDKAKECNIMWESEPENERQNLNAPHFKIISELIISIEIIDKSLFLFERNYKSLKREYEIHYYYLFWKQLRTELRDWIKRTPEIAKQLNIKIYTDQVETLFIKFEGHFEPVNK